MQLAKVRTLRNSMIVIASAVVIELSLGLAVNSLAIISDGLHAVFDTLTTLMLFLTTRMAMKPPDEEHTYGHEKFESIGGLVGGIALIGVSILIIYEAVLKIINKQTVVTGLEYVGFIAIAYTFCVDFYRVSSFLRTRKYESATMRAGLYHALADFASTIIAFVGFGLTTLGFVLGDSVASIVLGVLLSYFSVRLILSSGLELTDTMPKDLASKVKDEIITTKGVCSLKDLRMRKVGEKSFVSATLQVPDYMGLEEAHDLTQQVERRVKNVLGDAEVSLHTEPCEIHMPTEEQVEKLAAEVPGVKDVCDINVAFTEGRLYIILRVFVDPKLSFDEAHSIAEQIEKKIRSQVRDVEDVAVSVAPFSRRKQKGVAADEGQIRWVVHGIIDSYKRPIHVKRIVTYVAGKNRYINITCSYGAQVSVEEAHKLSSEIEERVKAQFVGTMVTMHLEPD